MTILARVLVAAVMACLLTPAFGQAQKAERPRTTALAAAAVGAAPADPGRPAPLLVAVTLQDIGFANGLRFSNLGGRRELFVPLPPGAQLSATELQLALDDVSAHEARRNLEILVNDRSAAAIGLDGKTMGRKVRVPLNRATGREGYLKLTFVYSGAATQDRCIDVRSIGDSLTVRPESTLEIELGSQTPDVATTAALMPRDVTIVLSSRTLTAGDLAAALTIGRALKIAGRRVSYHHGFNTLPELVKRDDPRRWTRGLVLVGAVDEIAEFIQFPAARVAGPAPTPGYGTLATVRAAGLPALLVSDISAVRAGRLLASNMLPAARNIPMSSVGDVVTPKSSGMRVTFDELGIVPATAEVYGRADIVFGIATRILPAGTRPARLNLDVMVAPDGVGEKAVVSAFVNERMLGSTVAAVGEPTKLELGLPEGLVGSDINVRVIVQRRSAQGDCRFEAQGYPAQILGSSALALEEAPGKPRDFAEMAAWWANGIEVWLPSPAAERPAPLMSLVADTLASLSSENAPITVKFNGDAPAPLMPFVAVSKLPPGGASPRVRFDRGRVAVTDRSGRTLLDLGDFTSGAVVQIVSAGSHPGLWLKPLSSDGALPAPPELRLNRGDVAFVDQTGVAVAMSSERDMLVRIAYPDQVSWFSIAERFHAWIVAALWGLVTVGFLFALQRFLRRRAAAAATPND